MSPSKYFFKWQENFQTIHLLYSKLTRKSKLAKNTFIVNLDHIQCVNPVSLLLTLNMYRSSRWQMFFKIGTLKYFVIFTGKQLCWSLFLINLQTWRPATLLKKDSNRGFFLWHLEEHLFIEHLRWLRLHAISQ